MADRRRLDLVAAEQRRELLEVEVLALGDLGRPERDEVEPAGLADELAHGLGIGDARQLDDDAVGALGGDDRLGDAGRVHAALDDVLDDRHVAGGRRLALDRQRLVLDAQAALEVEAQLRLDRPPRPVGALRVGKLESGEEIDDEGEIPMSRMRIGPALRIEAGCYTERWLPPRRRPDERRRTLPMGAVRDAGCIWAGSSSDPGRVVPRR